jgi:exodeoxyribonuclease VII small subunit
MATDKFEASLKKLEEIVKRLEAGSLTLEESLKAFEEGVKHSAFCSNRLDDAERRVEILLQQKDGSLIREPFESGED